VPRLLIDPAATGVFLTGKRPSDTFDDAGLARLGELAPNAEDIWLIRQRITKIPPSLAALARPFALHVAECTHLATLAGIDRLTALRALSLDALLAPALDEGCAELAELPDLVELSLVLGGRTTLPATLAQIHSLASLSLTVGPRFDLAAACDDVLSRCPRLRILALAGVEGALPEALGELAALEVLRLDDTKVTSIPPSAGRLRALREVHARDTKLVALPAELLALPALELVDVRGTRIREISDPTRARVLFTP